MLRRITLALLLGYGCAISLGQPLAERVPSDAVAYVGWGGSEKISGMEQSHLHEGLEASDASKLFSEFTPGLVNRVTRDNPNAAQGIQLFSSIASSLWRHPMAIYATGIDAVSPDQTLVKMGLICDAGDDSAELAKDFQLLISMAGGQAARIMEVKTAGTAVSLIVDHADVNPASLADTGKFKDAMSGLQNNPAAAMYVDVPGALAAIDQMVQANAPDSVEMWKKIENAAGLSSVKAMGWTGAFDGADWATQCFLEMPSSGASPDAVVSDQTLKMIPRDASLCTAWQFNAGAFLDKIRARLATVDPAYQQDYDKALGVASAMVGVNIKTDLIDSLGDQWVTFSAPEVAGSSVLGAVMVNKLSDAGKEEHALESVEIALNNIIAGQIHNSQVTVAFHSTEYRGATIHYLAVPLISPSWAIVDGNLYVGLYPQSIAGAVAFEKSGGASILDNPEFVQLRAGLKGESASAIKFANIPETIDASYPIWMAMSHYMGFADLMGVSSPPMLMPPIAAIKKELGPVMIVSYWDETGWHARSRAPFPGAMLLAGDPMTISPLGTSAIMASILLPSLNRARETANRIKCGSNMRQIGQAILLYSNEHNGKFPPDLGTLLLTEEIGPQVFLCPSSNSHLPPGFTTMSTEDQAAWVNKNSDYIYVGNGMNSSGPPDAIILYEKETNHRHDGMNILFGDGHVEFDNLAGAHQQLQQQLNKK